MQADAAAPGNALAMVCFGLGIAALLFAWRRTIMTSRGRWASPDCTAARVTHARQRIEQIQGEEWIAKRADALMISRSATSLNAAQREQLQALRPRAVAN